MGEYFGKTLLSEQWGYEKSRKWSFPVIIAYIWVRYSCWYSAGLADLASHMGEYFRLTLVLEQEGNRTSLEMVISCYNHLYRGILALLLLVFSNLCRASRVGGLVEIEDHSGGFAAHGAVLVGKLLFLGKSRSNLLCMARWVG